MSDTPAARVLRMEGIAKSFPGVQALDNVDLDVAAGEAVALLGENGAGKSTLMKILCGAYRRDAGRILINGQEVEIENPHKAQSLGISIIYQEFNLTRNQSVAANIFISREPRARGLGRYLGLVDRKRMEAEAGDLLKRIKAQISPRAIVGRLSVAQQQMVEIAKALAVEARIIIMDEPTAALGEKEVETLFEIVGKLKEQGIAVIFISHRLEEIFRVADRAVVLRDGRVVGKLPVAGASIDDIIHLMVGRSLKDFLYKEKAEIGAPILEVKGLTRHGQVKDVSFTLRRGEILGFAGLVGSGRTETARLIFGAEAADASGISLEGKRVSFRSPRAAVRAGFGYVPEDRGEQGLVLKLSVLENVVLPTLERHSRLRVVDNAKIRKTALDYIKKLAIRTPHLAQKAMYLSGGNQQKVVLAKWLAAEPRVLILDEPTRGIDVGSKAEIHALMSRLAKEGMGIIMISSELPEILGMSDRIVVMHEGGVAAILDRSEATQELIMAYASGQKNKTMGEEHGG
jgi:ribose transport system ATP-binding protein